MNTRNVTNTAFTSYPATGVELPNGRQLANTYDALYRRTLVQDVTNTVNVAAWQFFGPGRVAEVTLGNGLICSWLDNARTHSAVQPSVANPAWGSQSSDRLGYDGAGRPITKRYLAGGINGSTGAYNNSSAVVGFTSEYDLSSNKFYERHLHCDERSHLYEPFSNGAPTGGYDSLSRLRQYQRGTLTSNDGFAAAGGGLVATAITLPNTDIQRTYDLDSLGNWRRTVFTPEGGSQETEVRQHNGLNEITRIQNGTSQTNLTYDGVPGASNGNLANDGTRSYKWDALNRLLQVNRVSDGAIIGQYDYDALNRRIRKTVSNGGLSGTIPNETTDCLYTGWRCIEERNPFGGGGSTDTPTAQYIWGIYLDECLQQRLLVATNNFAANSDLYLLQGLLYTTIGLADSSGTVREAYDTDAYGNTLIFRNAGTPPGSIAWSDSDTQVDYPTCAYIYTGQRFDPETRIYYYKLRYYLPDVGRFAGRDQILSTAAYLYVIGNPTNLFDPFGLQNESPLPKTLTPEQLFLNWERFVRADIRQDTATRNSLWQQLTRGCVGVASLYLGYTSGACPFLEHCFLDEPDGLKRAIDWQKWMNSNSICCGAKGTGTNVYGRKTQAKIIAISFINFDPKAQRNTLVFVPDAWSRIDLSNAWSTIYRQGTSGFNFDFGILLPGGWAHANHFHDPNGPGGPMRAILSTQAEYEAIIKRYKEDTSRVPRGSFFDTTVYCAVCEADWTNWKPTPASSGRSPVGTERPM